MPHLSHFFPLCSKVSETGELLLGKTEQIPLTSFLSINATKMFLLLGKQRPGFPGQLLNPFTILFSLSHKVTSFPGSKTHSYRFLQKILFKLFVQNRFLQFLFYCSIASFPSLNFSCHLISGSWPTVPILFHCFSLFLFFSLFHGGLIHHFCSRETQCIGLMNLHSFFFLFTRPQKYFLSNNALLIWSVSMIFSPLTPKSFIFGKSGLLDLHVSFGKGGYFSSPPETMSSSLNIPKKQTEFSSLSTDIFVPQKATEPRLLA